MFLKLVRAGLWGKEARFLPCEEIDYSELLLLSERQSVVGLVTSGLKLVQGITVPQIEQLRFIGISAHYESLNEAMNRFVADFVKGLNDGKISYVLVKGQGLAQCYQKPLWRNCGDVDLLFDIINYKKAIAHLAPFASSCKMGGYYSKEVSFHFGSWNVELHGSLRTGLSTKIDKEVDLVQEDTFKNNHVRFWHYGETSVFLPSPDNDVFLVFTHFVKHFYKGGINLRQICDWCRLLWTYRGQIDVALLEKRLQRAGAMAEWKAFAALAVEYLEMPIDAMPLYSVNKKWQRKGEKIMGLIIDGNTHNKMRDTIAVAKIFPWNTLLFTPALFFNVNGLKIKERITTNR